MHSKTNIPIFHAADLHYSPNNLVEADRVFGFAVEDAIARDVKVAIIAGDSTDHRLEAHSPALLALARRIKQLADHCPVFMLQGTFSHEPAGMLQILGMIGATHPIIVSNRIEMIALSHGQWTTFDPMISYDSLDLVITSVPTVSKAELALNVGAENAGVAMGEHLANVLSGFGELNSQLRRQGIPTVLVSHGTVDGSLNETGVPMAGLDHEFSLGALYAANTSAVMLGHIHKHQVWKREFNGIVQMIAYPGSPGRFHYGEIGEKHYLLWNVGANCVALDAIVTPAKRMIDIVFDGAPNMAELQHVAEQCVDSYVRVRYCVDEEFAKTIDRHAIRDILGCAAEVKIEGSTLPIERQRCAGISRQSSVEDRYATWCAHTNTPVDGIMERLSQLQTMDANEIASAFCRANKRSGAFEPIVARAAISDKATEKEALFA